MNKKFDVIILGLLVILVFWGCGKSNERIAKTVKASLQENLSTDPQYSNLNLKVTSLQVEKMNRNAYQGMAKIDYRNDSYDVPLQITVEGTNITWDLEPGALNFISGKNGSLP